MRRILLTFVAVLMAVCSFAKEQREPSSFDLAKPVWSEAREKERNLTLTFCETVKVGRFDKASIRLTASCDYRLRVNGEFVAHGPCVAAHDFYRIDAYDLKPYLHRGKNSVTIEVAGYNCPSYYLLDQPSFLQAEVEYVPSTYTKLTSEDDITNMTKMLDMFEDNDDVQNVWHNWEEN